jgi:hypothetical protein
MWAPQCSPPLLQSHQSLSISFLPYSPVLPPNGDGDGGGSQGGRRREPGRISARANCARAAPAPGLPMEADLGEVASETLGESQRGPAATARRRPPSSPRRRIPARASGTYSAAATATAHTRGTPCPGCTAVAPAEARLARACCPPRRPRRAAMALGGRTRRRSLRPWCARQRPHLSRFDLPLPHSSCVGRATNSTSPPNPNHSSRVNALDGANRFEVNWSGKLHGLIMLWTDLI